MKMFVALTTVTMTLVLAACGGGSGSPSRSTTPTAATATLVTAATPTPAPVAVPSRPTGLTGYGSSIAAYITAAPAAAADCLTTLLAAWQMPVMNACRLANTDGDAAREIVIAVAQKPAAGDTQNKVLILDGSAGTYRVAYESAPFALDPTAALTTGPVLGVANLTGAPDIVYRTDACSAGICTTTVHVISAANDGTYVEQEPVGGISMAVAQAVALDEADHIVLTGGGGETPATGPERGRVEAWGWNGAAFAILDRKPAPPAYLYHAVLDADALLAAGNYAAAQYAFIVAIQDDQLRVWRTDSREHDELVSYGLFHAALAVLMAGGDASLARQYLDQSRAFTSTLHAQLAGSFEAAYEAKGSISIGCGAALDDVQANRAEYEKFWDFGTANPHFDSTTVCPF